LGEAFADPDGPGGSMTQQAGREGFGWGSLAEAGVFTLVVAGAATMLLVIRGFDPALAVDLLLMLVGLGLVNRDRRSGAIVLLIATVIFMIFGGFFAVQVLVVPRSTIYFLLNVVYMVAGTATLVASIALVRRGRSPSRPARLVALSAAVVIGLLAAAALVVRLAYEQPRPLAGDANLVAEDNEFRPVEMASSGDRLRVVVDNKDLALHTFSIEELQVSEDLPGGVRTEVTFEAEPGTYTYFCEIFGHDDMKGTLIVR
jgi:plastocyanin